MRTKRWFSVSVWLLAASVLSFFPGKLCSQDQSFGKNKVQYKDFEWYFIQSDHFDVYFTDGGDYLAEFTADVAESALVSLSKSFRYQINNRIPIIVYNSHNDFQQTNVVQEYLEEGIGGVTELFKNRVVVPFEGSYKQFRHVVHHELVHAVINDMFYGGSIQSIISNNIRLQLPLWLNEGMAEYQSLDGWDTNSDMFLRDATISEYLPPIDNLNGYFAYRGGQSVLWYIAEKYGKEKIGELLNKIKATHSVEQGFKSALGLSSEELNERWQKEQKVMYWPDIAKREDPTSYARRLTDHKKQGNFYNSSPTISPQGDKIAFISDRSDYFDIYLMSAIDGEVLKKVVSGQRTKDFEELHLLTPGLSWSPDGKKIALAAKSGEQDAIFLIDVQTGDQEKCVFDLDQIFSVDWSPQGDKIAFAASASSQSDIYVYDLNTKQLTNLTNDIFSDSDPSWSPDGKVLYFSSERGDYLNRHDFPPKFKMERHDYGQLDIYAMNLDTRATTRITNTKEADENQVVCSPDGKKILFISDRNGINNVYEKNLETGVERPITNSLTGVYQLSLSSDGNKLAFASMVNAGFDVFIMKTPFERTPKLPLEGTIASVGSTTTTGGTGSTSVASQDGKRFSVPGLEPTEFIKRRLNTLYASARSGPVNTADTLNGAKENALVKQEDSTQVYGENIKIDFKNYVFTETFPKDTLYAANRSGLFKPKDNLDTSGNFKSHKYKLSFSPDIIYGNAGYSTFYGVQGSTIMLFSDMLGNHEILFETNLLLDLKNSDYLLAYLYLPHRIDYGIVGFHSARFLILDNPEGRSNLYRFRNYGIQLMVSRPFDKFNRLDLSLTWNNLSRENIDETTLGDIQERTLILPSISYVHDNVLWGPTAPNNGSRSNLTLYASPKVSTQSLSFYTFLWDHREYLKFWSDYVFAYRLAGGISGGANPQKFFIGGTEGWINRTFENDQIPIEDVEDFAFLTPGLPLRGFNYNAKNGTKYALVNAELRFPLIKYLVTGALPILFQNIVGVAFLDVGSAWTENKAYRAFVKDQYGQTVTQDLLIGTGIGARMYFLVFLVRLDIAWQFNWQGFSEPRYYISIGPDF
jgi:Tol biopolymer transport system component